jgi:hypothetical protein
VQQYEFARTSNPLQKRIKTMGNERRQPFFGSSPEFAKQLYYQLLNLVSLLLME